MSIEVLGALGAEELSLITTWKKRHGLVSLPTPITVRVPVMIMVMCNSAPQLQDRLKFYWANTAQEVHPIMSHGGAIRLSSAGNFFDPSIFTGIDKALRIFRDLQRDVEHGVEGHYPCADACGRKLDLVATMRHTLSGADAYSKRFGLNGTLNVFFHLDYSNGRERRGRMETFAINSRAMSPLLDEL